MTVLTRLFGPICRWVRPNGSDAPHSFSREFLESLIDAAADPIFIKDRRHRWILLNDAFCALIGTARENLIGKCDHDVYPAAEADVFWETDESVFTTGRASIDEASFTGIDGVPHTIVTRKTVITDGRGNPVLVGTIRDITARKQAEREARETERSLQDILDHVPALVSVWDRDLRCRYFNPPGSIFNLPPEEWRGRHVSDIVGTEAAAAHQFYYARALAGEEVRFDMDQTAPSGEVHHLKIHFVPHRRGDAIVGFYAFGIDVTAEVEARQALERSEAELKQTAARLQTIIDNLPGMVYRMHYPADGNKRFLAIHKIPPNAFITAAELCASSPEQLRASIHPDDRPLAYDEARRLLLEKGHTRYRHRVVYEDEPVAWYFISETVVERHGDDMIVDGLALHITAEVEARQALERSEAELRQTAARLQSVIDNLPGLLLRMAYFGNGDKQVLYAAGDARFAPTRKSLPSITPAKFRTTIHPDDRARVFEGRTQELREHGEAEDRYRVLLPEGVRWLLTREKVVEWQGDGFITEGLAIDITAEVEARQALERSEAELKQTAARLQSVIDNLPGLLLRTAYFGNGDKQVLYAAGESHFARAKTSLASMTPAEFRTTIHPDDRARVFEGLTQKLRDHGEAEERFRVLQPEGGVRWLLVRERVVEWQGDGFITEGLAIDITAKAEARQALERSETELKQTAARLQTIIDNLPGMVYRMHYPADGNKRFLAIHKIGPTARFTATELCAWSPEQFRASVHPDDRPLVFDETRRLLLEKGDTRYRHRVVYEDGSVAWYFTTETVVERHGDEMIVDGMTFDITAEVEARQALERSEAELKQTAARLQSVIDNLPGLFLRMAYFGNGDKQVLSAAGDSRFTRTNMSLVSMTPAEFRTTIHPDDRERVFEGLTQKLREHGEAEERFRVLQPEGRVRWLLVRERVVEWQGDGFITEGLAIDITAEAEARQALERSEAELKENAAWLCKLSRAVEQNPNMILITDLQGRIEYVNARFTELTGYTAAEAIGRTPRLISSGLTPTETYAELWQTVLAGQGWRGEFMERRKDGQLFWVSISISPVTDDEGRITHFVAVHEDITARRLAAEELMRARDQAEVANRAKSTLLAGMSHELRTPLNAVIGYADALLLGLFGDLSNAKQREYVADIRGSGEHLLSIINDILDVSAIEAGKVQLDQQDVDLALVSEAAIRLIRGQAERSRVAVYNRVAADLPRVTGDERRLKQVLLNLLSNAVKFTPEGGRVDVSAAVTDDGRLTLSVADTGIGMSPHEIDKAMERFVQLDSGLNRKYEGTGLGLPLVKDLMELHDGIVAITSERSQGTTVAVTFPAERVAAAAALT